MKASIYILLVSVAVLLSACGGGGGGGSVGGDGVSQGNTNPEEPQELVFEFSPVPLQPQAVHIANIPQQEQNQFSPGDAISLSWFISLYGSVIIDIGITEQFLYDADVYLSADDVLQDSEDLKLFSIECTFPSTYTHACGSTASFRCVYAKDNENTISCTSIPLNMEVGFTDLTVDTTDFLDTIPKEVNVIFKACLRENADLCTEATVPIQLN